jgi:hypothetical protein
MRVGFPHFWGCENAQLGQSGPKSSNKINRYFAEIEMQYA